MLNSNKIRGRIKELGKTQEIVAKNMGISEMSLSRKLNGKRDFTLAEVESLCQELSIENPIPYFFASTFHVRNEKEVSA